MTPDLTNPDARDAYARQVALGDPIRPSEDHLVLLRHAHWSWDPTEFGSTAMDAKRPYGNSDVEDDLAGLLPHLDAIGRIKVHCELGGVLRWLLRADSL